MNNKNISINYWKILKQAWEITWKNKYLWWFGLFVSLSGSGSFSYSFNSENKSQNDLWNRPEVTDFIYNNFQWILIGASILLVIFIIFIILSLIGRGALIASIEKNIKGETSDFHSGMRDGKNNFGKIFLIALALGLFLFLTILILSLPVIFLFLSHDYLIGFFMAILAFFIALPIFILTAYLKIYGYIYVVLGKLNFWPAIENSYTLFRKNLASSILMGLLFFVIHIILSLTMLMIFIPIAIVFLAIGFVLFFIAGKIGIVIAVVVGLLSLFAACLVVLSFYETFAQVVWILFFHQIAKPKVEEIIAEPEKETNTIPKAMPVIELTKK